MASAWTITADEEPPFMLAPLRANEFIVRLRHGDGQGADAERKHIANL